MGKALIAVAVALTAAVLGIADEVRPRTKYGAGGDVAEVTMAQGAGTLGLTQISEIVGKPGGQFVGPLPEELQTYTGVTVGTPAGAPQSEPVAQFIRFLKSPAVAAAIAARGMQPN